ncbi:MAG: hypothetical protein M0P43_00045 [Arcobacteraceae bacterium]|jgi:hypothetical protein|nr:hypothetical protein [Arcobacteraceae bacterium]MDY0326699.1 hypothetical protein [Arcobacteraceae bacterium]
MKKLLLLMLLVHNIYALDSLSSIPDDQKKVLARVIEVLELPSNKNMKQVVFDKLGDFFTKNWSAHWTTNTTGVDTKIKNSNAQICDVTIYNDNRVVNCTFVHFKKEKQLFVTLKQYIEAESSSVLTLYNELKKDSKYSIENETENYAYFNEKGYMSYTTYHVKSPVGMVVYESSYFLDVE